MIGLLDGPVIANEVRVPAASVNNINDRDWEEFSHQAWRYSSERTIDHNIKIVQVEGENVSVGSIIGGSQPSRLLLKTGGELTGNTNFASLEYRFRQESHQPSRHGRRSAKEKWTICYPRLKNV